MAFSLRQTIKDNLSTDDLALLYNYSIVRKVTDLSKLLCISRQTATSKLKIASEKACVLLGNNKELITQNYQMPGENFFNMKKLYSSLDKKPAAAIMAAIEYGKPAGWQYIYEFDILIYDISICVKDKIDEIISLFTDNIALNYTYNDLLQDLKEKYSFISDLKLRQYLTNRQLKIKNNFVVSNTQNASLQEIIPFVIKTDWADKEINVKDEVLLNEIKNHIIDKYDVDPQELSLVTINRYITRYIPIYSAYTYLYSTLDDVKAYIDAIDIVKKELGNYRLRWSDLYNYYKDIWNCINIQNSDQLHHIIAQLVLDGYIKAKHSQYCVQFDTNKKESVFKPIEDYLKQEGAGQFIDKEELYLISDEVNVNKFFSTPMKNKPHIYRTNGKAIDLSTLGIPQVKVGLVKKTIDKMLKNSEYGYINIYDVHAMIKRIIKEYDFYSDRYLFHYLIYLFPQYKYSFPGIIEPDNGMTADEILNNVLSKITDKKEREEKGKAIFNKAYKEKIRLL